MVAPIFVEKRQIPSKVHFELFYAPKFFEWVNKVVPNKFPSLKGDHPRLVIPFFDENSKMFAFQGRAFGNEIPKYITITLDPDKDSPLKGKILLKGSLLILKYLLSRLHMPGCLPV